jgi:hypothetical protein
VNTAAAATVATATVIANGLSFMMGPRGACSFSPLNERPAELILRLDLSRF